MSKSNMNEKQISYTKKRVIELNDYFYDTFCPSECPHFSYNKTDLKPPVAPYCTLGFNCLNDVCPAKLFLESLKKEWSDMGKPTCISCSYHSMDETDCGIDFEYCEYHKKKIRDYRKICSHFNDTTEYPKVED